MGPFDDLICIDAFIFFVSHAYLISNFLNVQRRLFWPTVNMWSLTDWITVE